MKISTLVFGVLISGLVTLNFLSIRALREAREYNIKARRATSVMLLTRQTDMRDMWVLQTDFDVKVGQALTRVESLLKEIRAHARP